MLKENYYENDDTHPITCRGFERLRPGNFPDPDCHPLHCPRLPQSSMDGYAAVGGGQQIIFVVPESDLVIVTTADTQESVFELIEKYVLPAAQKSK